MQPLTNLWILTDFSDDRPQLQRVHSYDIPVTPIHIRLERDRSVSATTSSPSQAPTVIRWDTPPLRAPTPPQRSPETVEHYYEDTFDDEPYETYEPDVSFLSSPAPLIKRLEEQIRLDEEAAQRERREQILPELDLQPGPPTPMDDTIYIQYALDRLTDLPEVVQPNDSAASSDSYPVQRHVHHEGFRYIPPNLAHTRQDLALARKHRSSPGGDNLFNFNATRPLSDPTNVVGTNTPVRNLPLDVDMFIPLRKPPRNLRYPSLDHLPTILRPFSMFILVMFCLLMIAVLMFCANYSSSHHGLASWDGLHSGKYFVFGFLPQIFAACIFLYVQCVMAAMTRIMPFTLMAMGDAEKRVDALFLGVFPRTVLWPKWEGNTAFDISNTFFWLTVSTIPLQSCLFSVVFRDGVWRWVAVQGIAWTLVALYFLVITAAFTMAIFFIGRSTGLMWDPRSLADIFALLPRSNSLRDYPGTEIMRTKDELRSRLAGRSDRLGWWRTPNQHQGPFYCLGETGSTTRRYTIERGKLQEKENTQIDNMTEVEKGGELYNHDIRYRYIPWYLRDTYVVLWSVTAFVLLLALFIVSFLPSTAIRKGFNPYVRASPTNAGFSPANFLYSFIPSVLGMLLYLFFQPLDMAFRKLTPWSEFSNPKGALAADSLLLEYTAELPLLCSVRAYKHRHYRVAILSLLSVLFIILPVVAGGIFFPLTIRNGSVHMIPNLPSFYITLTLLSLYLLGLLLLIPGRLGMHLPHAVDSLAEIISFVYGSEILDDAAFRGPRSKADLVARLNALPARGPARTYAFGVYTGRHGKECMGIEKMGRSNQEITILPRS